MRRLIFLIPVVIGFIILGLFAEWKIAQSRFPVFQGDLPLTLDWSFQAPRTIQTIAVSSNNLILVRTNRQLIALDKTTGVQIWEYSVKDSVYITTPRVVENIVYDLDDYHVFALDVTSGSQLWSKQLQVDTSILEVSENYLFINRPSEDILALDRFSGEILWEVSTTRGLTMIFTDAPVIFAVNDGVREYNQRDGTLLWERIEAGILAADMYDQILYFIRRMSAASIGTEERYEIVAIDVETHAFLWRRYLSGNRDPYLTATAEYVLLSLNPYLYAISPDTGDILWHTKAKVGLKPAVLRGVVYVLEGFTRKLLAIKLHNGEELGYLEMSSPVITFTDQDILQVTEEYLVIANRDRLFYLTPK